MRGEERLVEYDVDSLSLAVLLSIYRGIKSPSEMASLLNVDEDSIKEVLKELEEKGLIKYEEQKILFFTRKVPKLTREGYNTIMAALEKIKPQLLEARNLLVQGREDEALELLSAVGLGLVAPLVLPLLLGSILFAPVPLTEHHSHIHPGQPF